MNSTLCTILYLVQYLQTFTGSHVSGVHVHVIHVRYLLVHVHSMYHTYVGNVISNPNYVYKDGHAVCIPIYLISPCKERHAKVQIVNGFAFGFYLYS